MEKKEICPASAGTSIPRIVASFQSSRIPSRETGGSPAAESQSLGPAAEGPKDLEIGNKKNLNIHGLRKF